MFYDQCSVWAFDRFSFSKVIWNPCREDLVCPGRWSNHVPVCTRSGCSFKVDVSFHFLIFELMPLFVTSLWNSWIDLRILWRFAGCGLLDVRLREVKRRCICPFTFLAWCGSTLSHDLTIHHPWTSKCLDSKRWTFFTTCSDGSDMVRFCQILHLISKLV